MPLFLGKEERSLVGILSRGASKALVYRVGQYPAAVSLLTTEGRCLTLYASQMKIADRFEIFPISIYEEGPSEDPDQEIPLQEFEQGCNVSILKKSEWDVPASEEDMKRYVGDAKGSTTQYEGRPSQAPDNSLHTVTFHAGIELRAPQGSNILIATSMYPYALYVSGCTFSEKIPHRIYERLELRRQAD